MKYLNVLFTFLLMSAVIFTGCAGIPTSTSPCVDLAPDESQICQIIPNPQNVDFVLRLANAGALEMDLYQAEDALRFLNATIDVLETSRVSYAELYRRLVEDVSPTVFVVLEEYEAPFLKLDMFITPKDIGFILYHLNRQRVLVIMAINAGREK
jgi:hypothetical protein